MGCCFSLSTTTTQQTSSTAKVITPSGALLEFSSPIKSSLVLDASSPFFICNSDRLFYDERVPALRPDEPVVPGQLYFVLPVQKLEFNLTGNEMAELAARATAALLTSTKGGRKQGMKKKEKKKKEEEEVGRVMPGGDDVCVDVRVSSRPVVVQKTKAVQRSRSTRVRVSPVSTRSNLGTIEEAEE